MNASESLFPIRQDWLPDLHENNPDWWWRDTAERALQHLAKSGRPFTAYDLTDLGVTDPRHPNQWGPLFAWAHAKGIIEPVGYRQSQRPSRASGVCRVWRGVQTPEEVEAA